MPQDQLIVRGAREHNLKNIDVVIPRDKLVVITGLSGSGKSSLAFDTIYAEGQRRYVESLSAYARQFLGLMEKPDVDQIEGLSPAISIDQRGTSRNPRSTVGTITEIYDYLRLLYARIGIPHCPQCGREISQQSIEQIVDTLLLYPEGSRLLILAPLIMDRKGEHKGVFEDIRKAGFVRVRVNGTVTEVDTPPELDRYKNHTIEAVVDRLIIRQHTDVNDEDSERTRLADSVETAIRLGGGVVLVADVTDPEKTHDRIFSEHFACPVCHISLPEIEPRTFSFNTPHGACPTCSGLGSQMEFDPDLLVPDKTKSLAKGAIKPFDSDTQTYYRSLLQAAAEFYKIPVDAPFSELSKHQANIVLNGGKHGDTITVSYENHDGFARSFQTEFEGVIPNLQRRYRETTSEYVHSELERYMTVRPCPSCGGKRLRPEALAVTILDMNIDEVSHFSIWGAIRWVEDLAGVPHSSVDKSTALAPRTDYSRNPLIGSGEKVPEGAPLDQRAYTIARQILKELDARLRFLMEVGLDYLSLDRMASTLSGGEGQRIRLATQIGSQLMGVMYILDEPSIGLHQRDNTRLLEALLRLRDLGNSVLVIEHDEETMRAADWIVDLGPGAGENGGYLVCSAPSDQFVNCPQSLTAAYLRGDLQIPVPPLRRTGNGNYLLVRNATENNLKHVDARFPLGKLICVTGVSGSGKSSLVVDVLFKALAQRMYRAKDHPGHHDAIDGLDNLDKVIDIDQSPIGRTPRSNPATYTSLFADIRELFAALPEAKARGYKPGRFSFNVKGGRCEACQGDGIIQIEMQFLPDVYVPCEVCHGRRYNREAMEIKYRGKSIADVLDMTVDEALDFFQNIPRIRPRLATLAEVGLGYVRLGQSGTTLSGGEAQRVKLAKELSRRATGKTLYILDEPTTGLHFADIKKLLEVLAQLVDQGNTVVVIEHNLDVIKSADWVIDLGPEGGDAGGYIIAEGTPEQVAAEPHSYTGQYLLPLLKGRAAKQPGQVLAERGLGQPLPQSVEEEIR
jgi:excinuclease ABC subunit A